jgi:prepilin-type N-terminal cleavage/methylation domain-containing protein
MDPTRRDLGFTLVELVVVMVLVGIMAGIVIPVLRPEKFRMDGAVVTVATTLMAQQRTAVLRQHDVVLAVDSVERRIRVHNDADNDMEIDTGEQWSVVELGEGVVIGRGGAPARPMSSLDISMTQRQGGLPALTFHRNGSASQEAIIYLTSDRAGPSTFAREARAIEIERATGRVTCYSYATGTWVKTC